MTGAGASAVTGAAAATAVNNNAAAVLLVLSALAEGGADGPVAALGADAGGHQVSHPGQPGSDKGRREIKTGGGPQTGSNDQGYLHLACGLDLIRQTELVTIVARGFNRRVYIRYDDIHLGRVLISKTDVVAVFARMEFLHLGVLPFRFKFRSRK